MKPSHIAAHPPHDPAPSPEALTGPAARGDWETVERHRTALAAMPGHRTELAGYDAMVSLARRLSLEEAAGAATAAADGAVDEAADARPVLAGGAEQVA